MGMRIGDRLFGLTFEAPDARQRTVTAQPREQVTQQSLGGGERDVIDISRAGFGDGTVSLPAVAVRALGNNLDASRQVVPSVEDIRAQRREELARERADERAEAIRGRQLDAIGRLDIQRQEAQARAQARQFINNLNQAADLTRQRLGGTAEQPENRPTITVGNQTFDLRQPPNTQRFDVLA